MFNRIRGVTLAVMSAMFSSSYVNPAIQYERARVDVRDQAAAYNERVEGAYWNVDGRTKYHRMSQPKRRKLARQMFDGADNRAGCIADDRAQARIDDMIPQRRNAVVACQIGA